MAEVIRNSPVCASISPPLLILKLPILLGDTSGTGLFPLVHPIEGKLKLALAVVENVIVRSSDAGLQDPPPLLVVAVSTTKPLATSSAPGL